ncbi:hypothetical protein ACFL96_14865 [Thermoproteota archaeon]
MISLSQIPRLRQIPEDPVTGATRIYENSPKIEVPVRLGNKILPVPAASVEEEELDSFLPCERYAGTIGGMFFITEQVPDDYRQFAAFHGLAEHAAPKGFDVTGLAAHYQAISIEMGYAKTVLSPKDYETYYDWRKNVERSDYFSLRHKEIIESMSIRIEEIFDKMHQYLTEDGETLVEMIDSQENTP